MWGQKYKGWFLLLTTFVDQLDPVFIYIFVDDIGGAVFQLHLFYLYLFFTGGMGGSMFRMHVGNGNEVHPEEIIVSFKDVRGVSYSCFSRQ